MPDKHRRNKAKPNDDEDFRNRKDKPKVNDSTNDDAQTFHSSRSWLPIGRKQKIKINTRKPVFHHTDQEGNSGDRFVLTFHTKVQRFLGKYIFLV